MTDATAAFHGSSSFDGRSPPGRRRRVIRSLVRGIGIGLGTAAAAGVLVTTGTVAAGWMIDAVRITNPDLNGKTLNGPAAIALADPALVFARAADVTGSIPGSTDQVSTDPAMADTADGLAFATRWAGGMFPAAMPVDAELPEPPLPESAGKLAAPAPPSQAAPPVAAASSAKPLAPPQARNKATPLPDPDSHTAVYDIAAHTVYLPNGTKLEAHSGLGD